MLLTYRYSIEEKLLGASFMFISMKIYYCSFLYPSVPVSMQTRPQLGLMKTYF